MLAASIYPRLRITSPSLSSSLTLNQSCTYPLLHMTNSMKLNNISRGKN